MNAPLQLFESAPAERRGKTSEAKSSLVYRFTTTSSRACSRCLLHLIISIAFAILVDCLISIAPRGKTSEAKSSLINNSKAMQTPSDWMAFVVLYWWQLLADETIIQNNYALNRARLHCF